jgi:hypothetical protein
LPAKDAKGRENSVDFFRMFRALRGHILKFELTGSLDFSSMIRCLKPVRFITFQCFFSSLITGFMYSVAAIKTVAAGNAARKSTCSYGKPAG